MQTARAIAGRSRCVRSAVGCVIVTPANAVVAVGYNGPPANYPVSSVRVIDTDGAWVTSMCNEWCPRVQTGGAPASYDDCVSSHAEMNALVRGARADFEGGKMYVTRVPCFTCAKVIANSGIAVVTYSPSIEDHDRQPERSLKMLTDSKVQVRVYAD